MGFGAVPRVPTPSEWEPLIDLLPRLDLHAAALQMRQQQERPVGADVEHHVVAGQADGSAFGSARLTQHVGHQDDLRAAGIVVRLAVVDEDYPAGSGSQDRAPEPDEDVRRLSRKESSPGPGSGPAPLVHRNEVDRVGGPERIGAVARHPVGWAVLHPTAT